MNIFIDESGIDEPEEEEEEVDINIDEGFLTDSAGNTVDIPIAEEVEVEQRFGGSPDPAPVNSAPGGGNTFIFFFCALGGHNAGGPVSLVDMLQTGLGNAAQSLSIAPVPAAVMRGGEVSSAYTEGRITTCGNGWTILSPYGYIYKPGVCYDYNIQNSGWETTGAELTSFRFTIFGFFMTDVDRNHSKQEGSHNNQVGKISPRNRRCQGEEVSKNCGGV